MFIYENHLGGFYGSDCELDQDQLYCDQCCDSDYLFGEFQTFNDFIQKIKDDYGIVDGYQCNNCMKKADFDDEQCESCDYGHGYYLNVLASDFCEHFEEMNKPIKFQVINQDGSIEQVVTTTVFGDCNLPPCSPKSVDSLELANSIAYSVFLDFIDATFCPENIKIEEENGGFVCKYFVE